MRSSPSKSATFIAELVSLQKAECTLEHAVCRDSWLTGKHAKGYCALHGVCGHRKDRSGLDCPRNEPGSTLGGQALQKLQDTCPQLVAEYGPDGQFCCTEEQIDTLSHQVAVSTFDICCHDKLLLNALLTYYMSAASTAH